MTHSREITDYMFNLTRTKLLPVAFLAANLVSTTAGAVAFTITGGDWQPGAGWAPACAAAGCDSGHSSLNMDWTIDSGLPQSFNLDTLGQFITIDFGAGTFSDEDNTLQAGETDGLDITGILKLSVPTLADAMSVGVAGTVTGTLSDSHVDLGITFDPITITFGSNGQFTVDLSDPGWTCNPSQACTYGSSQTQTITAKITLTNLDRPTGVDPAQVPEPATLVLLGLGIAGIGYQRRKNLKL